MLRDLCAWWRLVTDAEAEHWIAFVGTVAFIAIVFTLAAVLQ